MERQGGCDGSELGLKNTNGASFRRVNTTKQALNSVIRVKTNLEHKVRACYFGDSYSDLVQDPREVQPLLLSKQISGLLFDSL